MPNFNFLSPFGYNKLPLLIDYYPGIEGNGLVENLPNGCKRVQYVPSDHPTYWKREVNADLLKLRSSQCCHELYDDPEEMLYTTNNRNFRTPDNFEKNKPGLMSLGCSHTYGIGVRDHEAWPQRLANNFDLPNWNLGSGGQGVDYCLWVARSFFHQGYIPKAVAVWWPDLSRILVAEDSVSGIFRNNTSTDTIEHNILTTITEGHTYLPNVHALAPGDDPGGLNGLTRVVAKGQLARSRTQKLSDFLIKREYLILLCRSHNVPIVEYNSQLWDGGAEELDNKTVYNIPNVVLLPTDSRPMDFHYHSRKNNIEVGEWCPELFMETARDGSHHSGTLMKELADKFTFSFIKNYADFA